MNSHEANRIRGIMSVLDSELEGSRRMIGAMLTQNFAEMLDTKSTSKIVEEIGANLVRACQIVQDELLETIIDLDESGYDALVFEQNVKQALDELVAMGKVTEPFPGYYQIVAEPVPDPEADEWLRKYGH